MPIFDIPLFGFHIAPTWYGLMYTFGFIICYLFVKKNVVFRRDDIDTLLLLVFLGVVVGGRLGYILLYSPGYYLENPGEIIAVWNGGMSFHGGCAGVILAMLAFSYWKGYSFWKIADTLAVIIPVALGLGRIGNFINGELPGFSPYNGPFPVVIDGIPHFPSTLLQMSLEGILLFSTMYFTWRYLQKNHPKKEGILSAVFLIGYSIMRLIAEQFRLPDTHIGYLWGTDWITLGMVYTLPMILLGIVILLLSTRYPRILSSR